VRRTKARRRFLRAAVAAALAVTSSEAVRLRESSSMSLVPLLFSIDASIERYREAATAVLPVQSSAAEAVVDDIAVIIVVSLLVAPSCENSSTLRRVCSVVAYFFR
jgi:hypothetical protein